MKIRKAIVESRNNVIKADETSDICFVLYFSRDCGHVLLQTEIVSLVQSQNH